MNLKVVAVLTATAALVGCASTQNAERAALPQYDNLQLGYTIYSGHSTYDYSRGSVNYT